MHRKNVCKEHDKVVNQCRCMNANKAVIQVDCPYTDESHTQLKESHE